MPASAQWFLIVFVCHLLHSLISTTAAAEFCNHCDGTHGWVAESKLFHLLAPWPGADKGMKEWAFLLINIFKRKELSGCPTSKVVVVVEGRLKESGQTVISHSFYRGDGFAFFNDHHPLECGKERCLVIHCTKHSCSLLLFWDQLPLLRGMSQHPNEMLLWWFRCVANGK